MATIHPGGSSSLAMGMVGAASAASKHKNHIDLYDDSDDDHHDEFHDAKDDEDDWDDVTIATARTGEDTKLTHAEKREIMRQKLIREVMDKAMPDRHNIDLEVFMSDKTIEKGGCLVQFLKLMGCMSSSLHDAIANDSVRQVRAALKRMNEGKNKDPTLINALNENGRTAIVQACIMKKTDIIEILIGDDAELNLPDVSNGMTALMYSLVMEQDFPTVRMMVDAGAHINVADGRSVTPIMMAGSKGNAKAMQLLIAKSEHWEVDQVDENGWSSLHHAAYGGSAICCKLLLGQGADKNVRDPRGRRPLDLARYLDHGLCLAHLEDLKARLAFETGAHLEEDDQNSDDEGD